MPPRRPVNLQPPTFTGRTNELCQSRVSLATPAKWRRCRQKTRSSTAPQSPTAGRPSVGLAALPPDEGVIGAGLDQPTPARAGVTGKATRSSMKFASGGSREGAKNAPTRAHPALRTAAHHNTLSLRKPTATGCAGAAIESFASRQARGARLRESWKTRTTQGQPPQAKQTDWAVADADRMTPTAHPTQANASPVGAPKVRAFSSRPRFASRLSLALAFTGGLHRLRRQGKKRTSEPATTRTTAKRSHALK